MSVKWTLNGRQMSLMHLLDAFRPSIERSMSVKWAPNECNSAQHRKITQLFYCKIATLQKHCEMLLQYCCRNDKISAFEMLQHNMATILQYNITIRLVFQMLL